MAGRIIFKMIQGLVLIGILFSLISCGDERSIFWTIIGAREEEDNSLDNSLTILAMTDDGTNYYVSAGGSIWWQEMNLEDNEWEKVRFPENAIVCTSLNYYESSLYAAFVLDSGGAGLYETTNPTAKPPNWTNTNLDDPLITDKQIIKLMKTNSLLFISLQEPIPEPEEDDSEEESHKYSLYYFDGTDFFTINSNITNKSKPILDIAWNGSRYWTISGPKIYELNASLTNAVEITSVESKGDFGGILYHDSSGKYYVSSEKGNIYIYTGSNWDFFGDDELVEIDGKAVAFTDIMEVNGNIVIGTEGYGFYEMRSGSLNDLKRAGELDDMDSILSSDLYTSHILSLYKTSDLLFFCTGGKGLFHNTYDGDTWSEDWVRE